MEELRQLSDMDSSASERLQRMGQEQFFREMADKLEKAMEGQVASLGSSGELEEQEEEKEGVGKKPIVHPQYKRDDMDEKKCPEGSYLKKPKKAKTSLHKTWKQQD